MEFRNLQCLVAQDLGVADQHSLSIDHGADAFADAVVPAVT